MSFLTPSAIYPIFDLIRLSQVMRDIQSNGSIGPVGLTQGDFDIDENKVAEYLANNVSESDRDAILASMEEVSGSETRRDELGNSALLVLVNRRAARYF